MAPLQRFIVRKKLYNILKSAGASEEILTTRQIVTYLGNYIEKKKLHDKKNMKIIHCKGDALEDVFGVEIFTINSFKEVWNFIFPHVVPATNREVSQLENKETTSQNLDESSASRLDFNWMTQLPWWYFVQKDATKKNGDDAETVSGSLQDDSTAYVQDTEYSDSSDCDSFKVHSPGGRFMIEYEPDSCSSTDSDDTVPYYESEEETTTYSSTSIPLTDASDNTITEDYWQCSVCPNMNPPTLSYCQRCWKYRKNWLPFNTNGKSQSLPLDNKSDTPKLHSWSSNPQVFEGSNRSVSDHNDLPPLPPRAGHLEGSTDQIQQNVNVNQPVGIDVIDGKSLKRSRSSDSPETSVSKVRALENDSELANGRSFKKISAKPIPLNLPAGNEAQACSSEQKTGASSSLSFKKQQYPERPGICNICHENPNDASFVHGKTGHQYCCYKCALRVLKSQRKCPLCREPIELVIKNYIYQM